MKNKYFTPLMEIKKFDKENIVTQSALDVTNEDIVNSALKTEMQKKVDTAIENKVFNYSTGW